jgi:hypothetical protein
VTSAFCFPVPLPTAPVSLRSMCHDSVAPALFLSSKTKRALALLMASLRLVSLESELAMASKIVEEGNAPARQAISKSSMVVIAGSKTGNRRTAAYCPREA